MRNVIAAIALAGAALVARDGHAADIPIFDAHVHYSHDAWDNLPPPDAIAILRKAGLQRALVSSSGDEGTQRLVQTAPELVIPSLRPYRKRGDVATWVRDDTVTAFLEERLAGRQTYARLWWGGWLGFYATGTVVQSVRAGLEDEADGRADYTISAVKALIGTTRLLVARPQARLGAEPLLALPLGEPADCAARLAIGEETLRQNAKEADARWDWRRHAFNVGLNVVGGVAVLGVLRAAAMLKLKTNLVGIVPSAENMPGGTAYRPGDILTSYSGKTIEIINTDAEGRLLLADALTYACEMEPREVIDLATLTGACVVALGHYASGAFGDERIVERLKEVGERTGDRAWPLPLYDEYGDDMKSEVADIKNSGGRWGGASTAAAFLKFFVKPGVPWVHLDIAGNAWTTKTQPYNPVGATGAGVRLVAEYLAGS